MTAVAELELDLPQVDHITSPPRHSRPSVTHAPARSADSETIIARPRLLEQLDRGSRVTVVSAPAGSGKTCLLRSWVRTPGRDSSAWLALSRAERDPQGFWSAILSALRQTPTGSRVIREVTPAPHLDGWAMVDGLLADLAALEHPLELVIDDLDELAGTDAMGQLELLLASSRDLLRVVFSTRCELPLGLHRTRLAGELTELRAADLRFTPDEAQALLATLGVRLRDATLAVLVGRTEGWAAGLRLAALSMAEHPDPDRFVAEFSGRERTVAD
jgi:LuxR family maltose regulon positive regulatory protein